MAAGACRPAVDGSEASAAGAADGGVARRPDGVALEVPPAIPPAVERAEAAGIVALREPASPEQVREVVVSISDAWKRGSLDALRELLTSDAVPLEAPKGGRTSLLDGWKERLRAFPFDRLPGGSIFALDRITSCAYGELSPTGAPPRPVSMRPGEVYVRVPFDVTRLGSDRVFGDVLELVLRREGGRLKVAGYSETAER